MCVRKLFSYFSGFFTRYLNVVDVLSFYYTPYVHLLLVIPNVVLRDVFSTINWKPVRNISRLVPQKVTFDLMCT